MARPRNRNFKIVPGSEPAIDALKFEIGKNLGIQDIIDQYGWTGLTTLDAGNIGGAIQQVINELGQKELIRYYKEGRISEVAHLSPNAQPERDDLTRTRLINKVRNQHPGFQQVNQTNPGQPVVEPTNGSSPPPVQQQPLQ
jgi:hypothetical protein